MPSHTLANPSRRALIRHTALGATLSGFALATYPLHAAVIQTSKEGLTEGFVTIGKDKIPAYRAFPANRKDAAVIVVASEIFGVHEHIQDICRRLAKLGYYAMAPEYFYRLGDPKKYSDIAVLMREIIANTPDDTVFADTDAAYAYAVSEGGSPERQAITGFCWGGRIVWLYSARLSSSAKLKAGVAWYGRLIDKSPTPNPLQPNYPIDVIGQLRVPVLGLYGAKDTGIPLDDVQFVEDEINKEKKKAQFIVYPEAGHAFNADYRPSYHEASAQDGWAKMLAWFAENGVK